jgi:hypothetical protein
LIIGPHVNKYIFQPNIHQNSPEVLGVKRSLFFCKNKFSKKRDVLYFKFFDFIC